MTPPPPPHSSLTPHFDQGCDPTLESGRTIYYIYIVVYEPRQRVPFRIPVKSVSFKSFDYRRQMACAIARLVSQLGHIGRVRDENIVLQLAPGVTLVEQLRMPCGVCKSNDMNDTLLTGMLNAARLSCFAHCNI